MGQIQRAVSDFIGVKDEAAVKESLQQLKDQASANLQNFRNELERQYINKDVVGKTEICGHRAFKYLEEYHISSSSSLSSDLIGTVNKSVDNIFGSSGDMSSIGSGIKTLLIDGLSSFVSSNEAGESKKRMFFVIPENNAITRVDLFCWKYNFQAKAIVHNKDTAVAFLMAKSIVDHKSLIADELIFMVSDALSNGSYSLSSDTMQEKCYEFFLRKEEEEDGNGNKKEDKEKETFSIIIPISKFSKNFRSTTFNQKDPETKKLGNFAEQFIISQKSTDQNIKIEEKFKKSMNCWAVEFSGRKNYTLHKGSEKENDIFYQKFNHLIDEVNLQETLDYLDEINLFNKEKYDITRAEKKRTPASLSQINAYLTELISAINKVEEIRNIA